MEIGLFSRKITVEIEIFPKAVCGEFGFVGIVRQIRGGDLVQVAANLDFETVTVKAKLARGDQSGGCAI